MSADDPRFVGAWWLGFLCIGAAATLASLPLFCFPTSMKQPSPKKGGSKEKRVTLTGKGSLFEAAANGSHTFECVVSHMYSFQAV